MEEEPEFRDEYEEILDEIRPFSVDMLCKIFFPTFLKFLFLA